MRIDDSFSASNDLTTSGVGRADPMQRDSSRQSRRTDTSDSATLSSLALELARQIQTDPPSVVSRIEQLREAVRAGTYEEPASEVAAAIIDDSLAAQEPSAPKGGGAAAAGYADRGPIR